ncbi:alpha/beta fold hydrolase [Streptomyces sp. NBC_00344]|uniref:alpha/beta fold hydrolase n=1 Tax=Streptomyces sp. NBC_00344 TaxID=2975720 RepID=UPI002E209846
MTTATSTRTVSIDPGFSITVDEAGVGRPVLILHGGGGPATVAALSAYLSRSSHTITPTHPGWNGTAVSDRAGSIADLATLYLLYLRDRGLRDVLVVGSSIGGWIGVEMALGDHAGLITGLVLIDAVGVDVEGEPIRDVFALDARGVVTYSFHEPERFFVDPAIVPADRMALQRANVASLRAVAGDPYMHDPDLLRRLPRIELPVLLVWGESDRIVTPAYGRAYADAFRDARFEIVAEAGHLPHLEQPDAVFALIGTYAGR